MEMGGKAASVAALLAAFEERSFAADAERIVFGGVGDKDVYNITAPFEFGGETLMGGRVESRDTELAESIFFVERDGVWRPYTERSYPRLQDPCVALVGDELVFGGVEFPVELADGQKGWRMPFYRGRDWGDMRHFLTGPDKMKDIRLLELADGRIGVCSRPQGAIGGRGTIGFTVVDSLDELSARTIEGAPLLEGQFLPEEWGGANELHRLRNGLVGVLGHIARLDEAGKHYYAMAFALDPGTGATTPLKIIASRKCFPPGPAKLPELADVIFSGGLHRHGDGTATLYAGISDAWAAQVRLPDPFLDYE